MKSFSLLLIIFLLCHSGYAQKDYYNVDRKIRLIPDHLNISTEKIASYINTNFTSEADKVRAAYSWVIQNIAYDTDSMYAINWNKGGDLKITESLRRKKGVCDNFASIFTDIAAKTGLTGIAIDGYTKQGNVIHRTGHTWAAVNVDNSWYLFDPTWDKDRVNDYHYFMVMPETLSNSHMPFDPLWQLNDYPISHRAFHGRGVGRTEPLISHADSIKAFMRMSELARLQTAALRMQREDDISDLIRNKKAALEMMIATIYEERDMLVYNGSVEALNAATDTYNKFVLKVNAQDAPKDLISEHNKKLEPVLTLLKNTLDGLSEIGRYVPSHQYDPTALKSRLMEIIEKIRRVYPQEKSLTKIL